MITKYWNTIKQENPYHLFTLFVVFAVGFGYRLVFLFHPLVNDECFTYVYYASKPLSFGLTNYCTNNHPFNTFLVNISTRIFGNAEWALRFPIFICGVLTIPLVYILFRKLYNKTVGLIAIVFVSTSYMMVHYSVEARGYGIQTFLFLLLILTALYLKKNNTLRGWVVFGVIGVLGFYTLITNIYFFGAVAIWLFISAVIKDVSVERGVFIRNLILTCVSVGVVSVVLYLPFVIVSGLGSLTGNSIVKPLAFSYFVRELPKAFAFSYASWSVDVWWPIFLVLGVGFIVSIIFHKKIARDHCVNLALVIIGWCLVVLFAQRTLPYNRVFFPLLPMFFGFASAGVWFVGHRVKKHVLKKRRLISQPLVLNILIIGLTIILVFMVFVSKSSYGTGDVSGEFTGMDNRKIAEVLEENIQDGDMVYSNYFTVLGLSYYFERNGTPLSQLYGNVYGVPLTSPEEIKRVLVVFDLPHATLPQIMEYSNLDWSMCLDEPEENIVLAGEGFLFDIAVVPLENDES